MRDWSETIVGKLLAALVAGLSDRNPTVRMQYAKTIGQLMRTAKESSKEKLFLKLKTWYMEKEDEMTRASVAYTFKVRAVIFLLYTEKL